MDIYDSEYYGYACDLANSGDPELIVRMCERIVELLQENERLRLELKQVEYLAEIEGGSDK